MSQDELAFNLEHKLSETILLLGAEQPMREKALHAASKYFSYKIAVLCKDFPFGSFPFADIVIPGSPYEPENIISVIKEFQKHQKLIIKAVVPMNDFALKTAYKLSEHLGLPKLSSKTIENSRNKHSSKKLFRERNITCADSYLIENLNEIHSDIETLKLPLILKPLDLGGSIGVHKIEKASDLEGALNDTISSLDKYATAYDSSHNKLVLESFIDQKNEFSVEVFCQGNEVYPICVTKKRTTSAPNFTEIGHDVPATIDRDFDKSLKDLAIQACQTLGIDIGMAHVEIIEDVSKRLWVVEVGARPAGDGILDLIEASTNINPYQLHIHSYVGRSAEIPSIKIRSMHAIRFITFSSDETISNIDVSQPNLLAQKQAIKPISISTNITIGDRVSKLKGWADRYGYIIYSCPLETKSEDIDSIHDDLVRNTFITEQS